MPYIWDDQFEGTAASSEHTTVSRSRVLQEQFAQTFEENPIMATSRFAELHKAYRSGPRITKERALGILETNGLTGQLLVDENGITEQALETLMFRKKMELRRAEIFNRAQGGVVEGASRLGVALATTAVDPINVGLAFVPVMGQARYLKALEAAKGPLGRAAFRTGVGAAEGALGGAIVEPFIYGSRKYEQADYDAVDSLMNVAFGSLFGAALHPTVGGLADVVRRPRAATPARTEPTIEPEPEPEASGRQEPTIDEEGRIEDEVTEELEPAIAATAEPQVGEGFDAGKMVDEILSIPGEREKVDAIYAANAAKLREMQEGDPLTTAIDPAQHVERVREGVGQAILDQPIDVVRTGDVARAANEPAPDNAVAWRTLIERSFPEGEEYSAKLALESFDEMVGDGVSPRDAAFDELSPAGYWPDEFSLPEGALEARARTDEPGEVETLPNMQMRDKTLELQHKQEGESWKDWARRVAEKYGRSPEDYDDVIDGYMRDEELSERDAALLLLFEEEILPTKADVKAFGSKAYDPSQADIEATTGQYAEAVNVPAERPNLRVVGGTKQPDPEPILAIEQAEVTLKEVPEDPAEAIDEDLALAESDLRETEARLGVEEKEPDPDLELVEEAAEKAERWAKASEVAVTCLTRGVT